MDPLSFTASIVAVATLAATVGLKGYKYLEAAASRNAEVKQLMAGVRVLCGVLKQLEQVMGGDATQRSPEADACEVDGVDLDSMGVAASLLPSPLFVTECLRTLAEIENVLNKFNDQASKANESEHESKAWNMERLKRLNPKDLKWPLARSKTLELVSRLERHKSTCSLALQEYEISRIHEVLSQGQDSTQLLKHLNAGQERLIEVQTTEEQERALGWLSSVNPADKHQTFRSERCEGTGLWFFDLPEVANWLDTPNSALWVYGIPGAGKTVVSTLVVDMVLNAQRSPTIGTSYFYVRYDDPESQDPANILGSFLAQLGRQNSEAMQVVLDLYRDHTIAHSLPRCADDVHLIQAIREASSLFTNTYFLLDGLDECKTEFHADRARLLNVISSFQEELQCESHVIIFSRKSGDIEEALTQHTPISIAAVNADLRLYISWWLPIVDIQSVELAAEITDTLIEKAEGMFIWVRAQLDILRRLPNDAQKRAALQHLPPDLHRTYIRIFEAIDTCYPPQTRILIHATLCWLARDRATRPDYTLRLLVENQTLTVAALLAALDTHLTDLWSPGRPSIRRETLLRWLGSLVRVDRSGDCESLTLSHFTVEEFLHTKPESIQSEPARRYLVTPRQETYLLDVCAMYVSHTAFGQMYTENQINTLHELEVFESKFPFYKFAFSHLTKGLHDRSARRPRPHCVDRFLTTSSNNSFRFASKLATEWEMMGVKDVYNDHIQSPNRAPLLTPLSFACLIGSEADVDRLLEGGAIYEDRSSPLFQFVLNGHRILWNLLESATSVVLLIDDKDPSVPEGETRESCEEQLLAPDNEADTPSLGGHSRDRVAGKADLPVFKESVRQKIVRSLIEHGVDCKVTLRMAASYIGENSTEEFEACSLCSAVIAHDAVSANLLVDSGNSPHFLDKTSNTPISCSFGDIFAGHRHHFKRVERKLASSGNGILRRALKKWQGEQLMISPYPRVITISPYNEISSVASSDAGKEIDDLEHFLFACADGEWEDALDLLHGDETIDVNCKDQQGRFAIHYAATATNEVLEALLDYGADPNLVAPKGCTPLTEAAQHGLVSNVRLLLENDAKVDYRDEMGATALHHATYTSDLAIMRVLIGYGADVNAFSERYGFPLNSAAFGRSQPAINYLIAEGAEINMVSDTGATALHIAARCEDPQGQASKLLIDAGADVNLAIALEGPALHTAVQSANVPVVETIIGAGAAINSADAQGRTSLHIAAENGDDAMAQLLLRKGANIDLPNQDGDTGLHVAISTSSDEVVKLLLDAHANIHLLGANKETPLSAAALYGSADIVQLLLDAGSDINSRDFHNTDVLSFAAKRSQDDADIFYKLLAAGPSPRAKNNFDTTAVHYACINGHTNIVATLLEYTDNIYGCVNQVSLQYGTPLYQAVERNHMRILFLLLAAHANVDQTCRANLLGPAIMCAACHGDYEMVKCLASHGALLTHPDAKFGSIFGTARAFKQTKLLAVMGPEEDFTMDLSETESDDEAAVQA